MLKLPEPMLTFKGEDYKDFLKKHNNGLDLLLEYLENHASIPEYITRLIGQERTTTISRMILYILYFIVKEQAIFDWGKLVSIEIVS
jgi:hypothetical protein